MNVISGAEKLSVVVFNIIFWFGATCAEAQSCEALVWSDEFENGAAPNPENWVYDIGTGQNGWGNNESQSYTNSTENVRIENGILVIEAHKKNGVWTSSRIKTQGRRNFEFGRIEFRAKLPSGTGTWPALWMLGENITTVGWPECGEIDVMEHVGREPGKIHGSLHSPSSFGATVNTSTKIVNTYNTQFHTYAADWDADKIVFSIDGVNYYTYSPNPKNDANWPFTGQFFIIMNIAMGGTFGGEIDPGLDFARMEVDYVRVYQDIDNITISGEKVLEPNQSKVTFSTPFITGATYSWIVPEGVQVVAGQGTNEIVLDWNQSDGEVQVAVEANCRTFDASFNVQVQVTPTGSFYVLDDFSDANFDRWEGASLPNIFTLSEANNEMKIDYEVNDPSVLPFTIFNFPGITDMTEYSQLHIKLKTYNISRSVVVRADLFDNDGVSTTASPVFKLEPLIDDGEYFTYSFDFHSNWASSTNSSEVNSHKIAGLKLFINYGAFGAVAKDSIWLESIMISQPDASPSNLNRPSHLKAVWKNATVELSWQDNSDNEQGFALYRSLKEASDYTIVDDSINPDVTNYQDQSIANRTKYYYKILAYNDVGDSEYSNVATPEHAVVAGFYQYGFEGAIKLFPNPSDNFLNIHLDNSFALDGNIKMEVYNQVGQHLMSQVVVSNELKFDISGIAPGVFFVKISTGTHEVIKKLVKY